MIKDIWGQNMCPVINVLKRDLTLNHDNREYIFTIDVFLNFWLQALIIGRNGNDKHCGKNVFLLQVENHPQIITFCFLIKILGNLVERRTSHLLY